MYERVTIKRIFDDKGIEVSCDSSACSGCKGESFCNTKGKVFEAANPQGLPLEVGMEVELFLKPSSTIFSTLFTLIFPLALFPLAYYLAKMAGLQEGSSMLIGLGGIVGGFVLVWAFFKVYRDRYVPQILRIIAEEL
ncbi:MAG: Fis family transcriptional regulator [Spirochaetia bacterium]|nr:Fis family transcriptional regulator [Spirochaetia bacterium]